jgi:hypothetical protein
MMTIAVLALTIGHPGPILGTIWQANGFQLRERKTPRFIGEEKETVVTILPHKVRD